MMIFLFFFLTSVWVSPNLNGAQTPALYFQHVGESDKPISPIVIAVTEPSQNELIEIFGSDEWEFSLFFAVSAKDFQKLSKVLEPYLKRQTEGRSAFPFGSFKVTLVMDNSSQSIILPPSEFKKLLNEIYPLIVADYKSLKDYFDTLRKRLY